MSDLANRCYQRYLKFTGLAAFIEAEVPAEEGWGVVLRFYAVLHLMNAFLVDKANIRLDLSATAHEARKAAMARYPELRDAPKKYRDMKDLSENVRYDPYFEIADSHRDESRRLLEKIVSIVDPKIKKT